MVAPGCSICRFLECESRPVAGCKLSVRCHGPRAGERHTLVSHQPTRAALARPCTWPRGGPFAPPSRGLSGGDGALSGGRQEPRRQKSRHPCHRCSPKLIQTTPNPKLSLSPGRAGTPLTELQIALCPLDEQDRQPVSQATWRPGRRGEQAAEPELPPECRRSCLSLLPPWANPPVLLEEHREHQGQMAVLAAPGLWASLSPWGRGGVARQTLYYLGRCA